MARRRPYFAPLAVVLAALVPLAPALAKSVETAISTDKQVANLLPTAKLNTHEDPFSFVLQPSKEGPIFADHRSHRSHSSHRSHRSHYSSR